MNTPRRASPVWPWLLALALVALVAFWLGTRHGAEAPVVAPPTQLPSTSGPATSSPPASREGRSSARRGRDSNTSPATGALPAEAADTIRLIQQGGPFPFRQDGSVFGNREGLLPQQPNGYYHEYTVVTPGASNRATRRIITGGRPPVEWYYTDDHYRSFRRFQPGSP